MQLNYIKEINSFYDWLETNTMTDSAIVLWHALMHVSNRAGWPSEFTVAQSTLSTKSGLKKDAIIRARLRLQQLGRIDFNSRSGQQSAVYRIIPFESFKTTQTATQVVSVVLNDTNSDTNRAQTATQTATQTEHKPRPLLKETKPNETNLSTTPVPDESFRVFEQEGFGTLSSFLADDVGDLIDTYTDQWVVQALRESARNGKRNLKYATAILKRWKADGIDSPWEATDKRPAEAARGGGRNGGFSRKPKLDVIQPSSSPDEHLSADELEELRKLAFKLDGKVGVTTGAE